MKRKFLSIISLLLALSMILPMSIFVSADEEGGTETPTTTSEPLKIFYVSKTNGSSSGTSEKVEATDTINGYVGYTWTLEATGGEEPYEWSSSKSSIATVSNGTVTAISAGTVTITVADKNNTTASATFSLVKNNCKSISVADTYTKTYVSGQSFDKSSLDITAEYDDGTTKKLTGADVIVEPDGALTASNTSVTVKYGDVTKTVAVTVSEKTVDKIELINATTTFTEGDAIPAYQLRVTYNDKTSSTLISGYDVYVGGSLVPSNYTFKTTDKKIQIKYGGKSTDEYAITVKQKASTTYTYTATMYTAPTKTTYKVDESLEEAGLSVKVYKNGTEVSNSVSKVTFSSYKFTTSDVGKTSITIPVTITLSKADEAGLLQYTVNLTITGLTIKDASEAVEIYTVTGVEMEEKSYPVGYKFSLSDIEYFTYRESRSSTKTYKIYGYELVNGKYSNSFDLEVLTNKNDKTSSKSSKYMYTLEDDDVFENEKTDETYAYLRLSYDKDYYDFTVDVGGSGVYFYYDDDLIAVYDDIDEAIEYTMDQDKDVKDDFDLDKVKDSKDITLVLGEDQKVSAKTDFEICHNVTIDLAGYTLEFYTDTVDITKTNKDYVLTVTNTSAKDAKFTYDDKDIEITLQKGDKLEFEYEKDVPGIITLKLSVGNNGKVTSVPAADKYSEITVGQGSDIKFTITPDDGYAIDTIKLDSKSVSASDYTTSTKGVTTYTLKSVSKSQTVTVSFKKGVSTWKNPFSDVSSSDSYYSAVQFVYENGLFNGTTTTKFGPDTTMTRAMFVTVLGRLAGVDVSRFKTSSYSDVPINSDTSWYAPYVEWATQMGLVDGYGDGTFGPNNKITHQQMYVLMYRYTIFVENEPAKVTNTSINASDAEDVADWAKTAVKFASQNNFLVKVGTSSRIDPTGEAKRSELAQLLEKYCDVILDWNAED